MTAPALQFLDHPLARVAYADTGRGGPALVWLHGALCSQADWVGSVAHFAGRHRCIALDLPGHGASPAGPAAIGIQAYARIVRDLCAALALDDVVLIAHSMGCRVALQAAVGTQAQEPPALRLNPGSAPPPSGLQRLSPGGQGEQDADAEPHAGPLPGLRGLVLVDGAYLTPRLLGDAGATERQALAAQARARAAALYETAAPMERAARGFGQMFFDPAFDAVRDRMVERARALPPEVARTLMPDFAAWDVEHMEQVLPRLRVPVLAFVCTFMNSAHERVRLGADTRTPWIEALERHVRALELVRVPGAGHFPMLEQPQAVHSRIDAWLQGLPAPGGAADAAGTAHRCGGAAHTPAAAQTPLGAAGTPTAAWPPCHGAADAPAPPHAPHP
jgi:pimeloyl-ACP methyl ester carboxylesterase